MADYFSEYSSFIGAKGLPSPVDTPYETPGFIRSKRSSRATAGGSSREQSESPPPLPPDATEAQDKARDGRYTGMDPRRFTPTLHASLVSEILNLRRELDSKNSLVEDLESTLSIAKSENDTLSGKLSESAREVRKAKQQVQQMEQGTYDAVEDLVRERDDAKALLEDLRGKLEITQKKTRQQDEDAQRTQTIWETDKEAWDSERRQLERRIHVTETRLRALVDEMTTQQSSVPVFNLPDESTFQDSGIGNECDSSSIHSATPSESPKKHRRNASSVSYKPRQTRASVSSRATAPTPDLYFRPGNTLADELDIDELDEYDNEGSVNGEDVYGQASQLRRASASRHNSVVEELDAKLKRNLGPATDLSCPKDVPKPLAGSKELQEPIKLYRDRATTPPPATFHMPEPALRAVYVDSGYQPSPPVSPPRVEVTQAVDDTAVVAKAISGDDMRQQPPPAININATLQQPQQQIQSKPISPPQTPVVEGVDWVQHKAQLTVVLEYSTASTQTELVEPERPKTGHTPKRDSLSPPPFVPSIAIHPPNSRPSSPRPYVLPPGTKNAFTQASLVWPRQDASVQTEEIRVDKRAVKLPAHLLPSALLPSPTFQEPTRPLAPAKRISASSVLTKRASVIRPPAIVIPASPPLQSPPDSSPEMFRSSGARDLRNHPLKALPLPRPILSPPLPINETFTSNGPLNRTSQYGVTQPRVDYMGGQEPDSSEQSDYDDPVEDNEPADLIASMPASSRPPLGRFGLSDPPKAVPEDKEISPERRPGTADSLGPAPAPSISSSRANSQRRHKPSARSGRSPRSPISRSSFASSGYSAHQNEPLPPFPIPLRSSSRPKPHSEGSQSPITHDGFSSRTGRTGRPTHPRQVSLRKVQSAAVIRNRAGRGSPTKSRSPTKSHRVPTKAHRGRRRSPELTPVQSLAFESPAPTKFPIPELPSPVRDSLSYNYTKGSVDLRGSPGASTRVSEETNLVDAIAGTMVGEWMWKYIRKRKSFGIGDDNSELPVAAESGIVNVTAHGTRHKRWVWLSPYERTIMWDTKQPTSGPALLGKKGRKLAIQSVLDVQDPTPLPKNPELGTAWGRSILILTPERALKFTCTTEERHGLWMTALTFLARQGQLPSLIPQMPSRMPPPIPPMPPSELDGVPIKRQRSPSFGRSNVRDSIRLTKGKRADLHKVQSHPDQPYSADFIDAGVPGVAPESADFPAVPRLYISTSRHQRDRSNTNPGFRSFSSTGVPSSASSAMHYISANASSFRPSISTKSGSRRESFASPTTATTTHSNFFEAVGTVRMEAFVDPNVRDGVLYVPAPPPVIGGARRPRRSSNLSQSTVDKRRAGYVFDEDGMDPFKGF